MGTQNKKPHAKCPKCGSENFFVHEFIYYEAMTDRHDKHRIVCLDKGRGINLIKCANCNYDCTELDLTTGIEFEFS
jgi:predicted nucleic-acid-binding Zn-ribbon protein